MKRCPACGSELEDNERICSYCGKSVATRPDGKNFKAVPSDISARLQKLKKRFESVEDKLSDDARRSRADLPPPPPPDLEEEKPAEKIIEVDSEASERKIIAPVERAEVQKGDEKDVEEPDIETPDIEIGETAEYDEPEAELIREEYKVPLNGFKSVSKGAINGLGLDLSPSPPEKIQIDEKTRHHDPKFGRFKIKAIEKYLVIAVLVIIVIASVSWYFLFGLSESLDDTPDVDGDFEDWSAITAYHSLSVPENGHMDFIKNAVQYDEDRIYWYFMIDGYLYEGPEQVTSYALLIDADGDPDTGFSLYRYFGADLMVMVSGSDSLPLSNEISKFTSDDNSNWSEWIEVTNSLNIREGIDQAECSFRIPDEVLFESDAARFVGVAFDGVSESSMTPIFALEPGVLIVNQRSLISPNGIVPIGTEVDILELNLEAQGTVRPISDIIPVVMNAELIGDLSANWVNVDEMDYRATMTLKLDTTSSSTANITSVEVIPESLVTEFPSVMIIGHPAIGYASELPAGISIDGCFADWTSFVSDLDLIPVDNSDIDINKIATEADNTHAYFYADVGGGMMSGALVPVDKRVIGIPGPSLPPALIPRISGEDIMNIFIDVDPMGDTGAPTPTYEVEIEPDYLISILGRNGEVTGRNLFEWSGYWSEAQSSDIETALDDSRMEVGISKQSLGGNLTQAEFLIMMTDWRADEDASSLLGPPVDPFKINISGSVWWSADGTSWTPRTSILPSTDSAIDLTADNSDYLYAIFTNGTVYRSTDGAASWYKLIEEHDYQNEGDAVGITCDRNNMLYMLTRKGIAFNASVSGSIWTERGQTNPVNNFIDIDWADGTGIGNTVLYSTKYTTSPQGTIIMNSTDGGATWTEVTNEAPTDSEVSAISAVRVGANDRLYVLEIDGDVRVSNDSGVNWESTQISAGGGTSDCIDLDSDDSNDIWVVRMQGEIYKLDVILWQWTTVYSSLDLDDVQAMSTAPIPEFEHFALIIGIFLIVSLASMRRKGKRE